MAKEERNKEDQQGHRGPNGEKAGHNQFDGIACNCNGWQMMQAWHGTARGAGLAQHSKRAEDTRGDGMRRAI
jgi:hypothetical protein